MPSKLGLVTLEPEFEEQVFERFDGFFIAAIVDQIDGGNGVRIFRLREAGRSVRQRRQGVEQDLFEVLHRVAHDFATEVGIRVLGQGANELFLTIIMDLDIAGNPDESLDPFRL